MFKNLHSQLGCIHDVLAQRAPKPGTRLGIASRSGPTLAAGPTATVTLDRRCFLLFNHFHIRLLVPVDQRDPVGSCKHLDVPVGFVRIPMVIGSMDDNLLINGVYWGYNPLILTFHPNFLRHPSGWGISAKLLSQIHFVRFWMILIQLFYILWTWTHLGRMFLSQIFMLDFSMILGNVFSRLYSV